MTDPEPLPIFVNQWPESYIESKTQLFRNISDLITRKNLVTWTNNASFKGRGEFLFPNSDIFGWLNQTLNHQRYQFTLFWRILDDQDNAEQEDQELAQKIKNLIKQSKIASLFLSSQ